MCNFVLPGEKKLPGDRSANQLQHYAGEESYTKRETELKINNGTKAMNNIQYAINKNSASAIVDSAEKTGKFFKANIKEKDRKASVEED